jgi:tRNA G10  N-methylase Trm11
VQKANKHGTGKFLDFTAEGVSARLVIGDTAEARSLLLRKRFDLIVTDIPYGVQHMGGKAARSPFETLQAAAPGWAQSLAPGGAMVIGFNSYQPKRAALVELFTSLGLTEISCDLEHRMSESILRDVVILRK